MYTFGIIIIFSVQFLCNLALQEVKCSGHVCIPPNYEKLNRPFHKEILPVSINFSKIWIQEVDDLEHTISLSLQIWMTWEEPRLEVVNGTLQENKSYAIDKSFLNLLWIPDLYIYDAKKIDKNGMVSDLESLAYEPKSNTHFLTYLVTLNVEVVCHHLNFDNYPFDSHVCLFEIGSHTYPKEELIVSELIKGNDIYSQQKGFLCSI